MLIDEGNYKLYKGDCLETMDELIKEDIKVDAVICDPPYGSTACKWDVIIPFDDMWERLNKLTKPEGAIVLFGNGIFSSNLKISNIKNYKYDWIWIKNIKTNFQHAHRQPLRQYETINVFYRKQCTYNPQKTYGHTPTQKATKSTNGNLLYQTKERPAYEGGSTERFPSNILYYDVVDIKKRMHPTQKPVDLLEYLIRTYTNEGELVLDFTMGSGSTGVACLNTNRRFIGIELDEKYFNIAIKRLKDIEK